MARQPLQKYFVFYFHEWQIPDPSYFWVDEVKGKNPQDALKRNLPRLLRLVRKVLDLNKDEGADYKFERSLYIVPAESWLSSGAVYWEASLSASVKT